MLSDTCRVRPTVGTADVYNADAASWPTVSRTVACMVAEAKPSASGFGALIDLPPNKPAKRILFPHGVSIEATWRIEWVEGGVTYSAVQGTKPGSHNLNNECLCVEV